MNKDDLMLGNKYKGLNHISGQRCRPSRLYLVLPLWVQSQELLKSVQLMLNPFDVIQLVPSDDNFLSSVHLSDRCHFFQNARGFSVCGSEVG